MSSFDPLVTLPISLFALQAGLPKMDGANQRAGVPGAGVMAPRDSTHLLCLRRIGTIRPNATQSGQLPLEPSRLPLVTKHNRRGAQANYRQQSKPGIQTVAGFNGAWHYRRPPNKAEPRVARVIGTTRIVPGLLHSTDRRAILHGYEQRQSIPCTVV